MEFSRQRGNLALDVWSESPTYRVGEIVLNVLNRSIDRDLTPRIESQSGPLQPTVNVWELNHPDLEATHGFGDDERVRPVERNEAIRIEDDAFTYTFPAHSLTVLRLRRP